MRSLIRTVMRQIQTLRWWVIERAADREVSQQPAMNVDELLEDSKRKGKG